MEVANVRLRLNKVGSDVPLNNVTPPEAMFLHILHGPQNGGLTFGEEFTKIELIGTAKVMQSPEIVEEREPDFIAPATAAVGEEGKADFIPSQPPKLVKGKVIVAGKPAVLRDRTDAEELRRLQGKYSGARDKTNKPIIDSIWPDKFNPKLPQTFKELKWSEIGQTAAGIEVASVNYATGGLVKSSL